MTYIPNALSFFRIALIPLFVWQMYIGEAFYAAVTLCVSAVTDFLDGFLARRFGWITQFGKILDPFADKLTQVTVSIVLAVKYSQYWYFFAALLFKELVMLILGGYIYKKGISIEGSRWFGKFVTCLFYATTIMIVFLPDIPHTALVKALLFTTICAFAAGLMYIPEFIKYKQDIGRKE